MAQRKDDRHKERAAEQNHHNDRADALLGALILPRADVLPHKRRDGDGKRLDRKPGEVIDLVADIIAGGVGFAERVDLGDAEDHAEGDRRLLKPCGQTDAQHSEKDLLFAAEAKRMDGEIRVLAVDMENAEKPGHKLRNDR